jgi:site-specific recombinase XerD
MDFTLIKRGKKSKEKPTFYSKREISAILESTDNLKHKAILTIIYSAGLRVGEAIDLRINDILPDRMQIFVKNGKGSVDRYTILAERTLNLLREYYKKYKPEKYLFEGQSGGKYSASSIRKVLENSIKKAGIIKKGSTHSLRHSFATLM